MGNGTAAPQPPRWDFFIAHAGGDTDAAKELHRALRRRHCKVFLDRAELLPGDHWPTELKRHLANSDTFVVLISDNTGEAYYELEEIAIAIDLSRRRSFQHAVVPVLLKGATAETVPYGLVSLTYITQRGDGFSDVAGELVDGARRRSQRPPTEMMANATANFDTIASATGLATKAPGGYSMTVTTDGDDLVSDYAGGQRITRDEFEQKLSADQLRYVVTLERSMDVNVALWEQSYPLRTTEGDAATQTEAAVSAMREDLEGVLSLLEDAGLWLDDHYLLVRQTLARHN
jgi:hypothetical protein